MLKPPQLGLKTNPPLIQEKPQKTSKKPAPTKEELIKMTVCIFISGSMVHFSCVNMLNVIKRLRSHLRLMCAFRKH